MRLIYTDDDIRQYLELKQGESTLGRSSQATFTIRNDTISKVHVKFTFNDGILEVQDLDSSNGTFVNGVKISKIKLKPQDTLKIGKYEFDLEFSQEELAAYTKGDTDTPAPDDQTPLGSEAVAEKQGNASETFFDVSKIERSTTPQVVASSPQGKNDTPLAGATAPSTTQSILANRKLLLMATGGVIILMMMALILKELGAPKNEPSMGVARSANPNLDKYEKLLKEGLASFREDPVSAKNIFSSAMANVTNKNSCLALMRLCDIWLESDKSWHKVKRFDFRKAIDDLRNEDEGQPGAILFDFIRSVSDEERESLKVENEYAKFASLLEQGMIADAEKKILDIDRNSPLRSMAESRFKTAKLKLINSIKDEIEIARTTSQPQLELRRITALIKLLDPSETIDYRKRIEKLKQNLEKGKAWTDGKKHYNEKNYIEAKDILKLLDPSDENYAEAQTIIKEIELDEVKKQVQLFYEIQGDAKTAISIIDKSYSAAFLDLKNKIAEVSKTFEEGVRLGDIDNDNSKAHDLMHKVIELEPNAENAYHKKAQEYLTTWTDPVNKCKRLYDDAKKKVNLRDFEKARELIETIKNTNEQYDTSEVSKKIEGHVSKEMNINVYNAKSDSVKKRTLEELSKIVRRGDRHFDEIQRLLITVQ